tara:strand:- start:51 stop:491 length:441 start_codon:yes stop_codon:yes gene_type:complete
MPVYYHIHRGTSNSKLDKKFIKNKPLYFSKKNSFWYRVELEISKDEEYNGYSIYKITIPEKLFTYSFNPRTKTPKIIKINKHNTDKYVKRDFNIEELKKKNIIGIDANLPTSKENIHKTLKYPPEGYIWELHKDIKIEKIAFVKFH